MTQGVDFMNPLSTHMPLDKMQKSLHKTINHTKEYAHSDVHTNTVESAFSLLKRGIVGRWHRVSAKHLPA